MIALLLGGTLVLCAGVLAIVFGVPIKEFSVGGTLIQSGAVVASAGILLIGMGLVVRELKQLGRRFEAGFPVGRPASQLPEVVVATVPPAEMPRAPRPASRAPGNGDFLFPRDQPHESPSLDELDVPLPPVQPAPPPPAQWPDEEVQSERTREHEPAPRELFSREPAARPRPPLPPRAERAEAPAEDKPRRDFLFSSRRRGSAEQPPLAPPPRAAAPGPDFGEPSGLIEPPLFDAAWPAPDAPRAEPQPMPEPPRAVRPKPQSPQPRFAPPPRRETIVREEAAEVTVVKSGVVDTMAYSLYSDGSIEAQLPEGTVRFESIEELRTHLDQRGM